MRRLPEALRDVHRVHIQARLHGRSGMLSTPAISSICNSPGAQHEHLTINRGDFLQRCPDGFFQFLAEDWCRGEGSFSFASCKDVPVRIVRVSRPLGFFVLCHHDECRGDGEEPGFEFRFAVILVGALENSGQVS